MEIQTIEVQMRTIAEELARVYLGHDALNKKLLADRTGKSTWDLKSQVEAAIVIKHWGF
jgi:hypothetical protein